MNDKRKRGFEVISRYKDAGLSLPVRKTAASAGYDLESVEDVCLEPHSVTIVPTGMKAYMQDDEYLGIHVRSGFAIKHKISCINSQGVIDADYYNSPANEGHIMVPLINHGDQAVYVSKGMRIAQGIFYKYLVADGDKAGTGALRTGGFGSTGED